MTEPGPADRDPVLLRPGFDHATDPLLLAGSQAGWAALAAQGRAFRSDLAGSYDLWYLLRYDDIRAALEDYELFSSRSVQYLDNGPSRMIPEELDPPEHAAYRRLLNEPLSPGAVRALEPEIRSGCAALVAGLASRGQCEFLTDFALPFPGMIFMRLLGLPADRTAGFIARAQALLRSTAADDPGFARRRAAAGQITADIAEALDRHRSAAERGDDILSRLLGSTVDGRPLTDAELTQMGFLLYLAGLDTVASALAFAFRYLAGQPGLRAALAAEPARIPAAVEELLRYFSFVSTARVVTRDAEFAGCPMKAGDRVVLPLAAADRDPAEFGDPAEFRPGRSPNRHLAFGAGPHRCAGSHLARLELQVAIAEWHRLIPDYEVAPGTAIREYAGGVAGLSSLPLTWG